MLSIYENLHPSTYPLAVRQIRWLGRKGWTNFQAPIFDFGFDGIPDLAGARKFLVVAALLSGGIGEAPVQASGHAGEDGTAFGARLVADGDDISEGFAGFEDIEDGFRLFAGNVD